MHAHEIGSTVTGLLAINMHIGDSILQLFQDRRVAVHGSVVLCMEMLGDKQRPRSLAETLLGLLRPSEPLTHDKMSM